MNTVFAPTTESQAAATTGTTGNRYAVAPEVNEYARRAQAAALAAAVEAGPAALLAFAKSEQEKRDRRADKEWTEYRLYRPAGCTFAAGVQNSASSRYHCETTGEGVKRFVACEAEGAVGCPDQEFCDRVNEALRGAGLVFRLEVKHARIMFLRERAASAGLLSWERRSVEVAA